MIVRFQEIYVGILTIMGLTETSVDSTVFTEIKNRINQIQDNIFYETNWEWRRRNYYFTTRPPYETGTISITQGSKTVTGSGTSWSDIIKIKSL